MRFQEYWKILSRWWPVLAVLVLTTAVASGLYSKLQTKIYRATSVISINSARFDYGQQMAAATLLSNYALQIRRPELVERVDTELKLDLDPTVLRGHIKVVPTNESLSEQIDVDDSDPQRAALIATALAQAFVQEVTEKQQSLQAQERIEATLLEPATIPTAPNRPKTKVNVGVGALVGLILGMVVAFALESLDDTVKTADDVDAVLGLPVLGTIPRYGTGARRRMAGPTVQNGRAPETKVEPDVVVAGTPDVERRR